MPTSTTTPRTAYKHYSSIARAQRAQAAHDTAQHYLHTLRGLRTVNGSRPFNATGVARAAINALQCAGYIKPAGNHNTYYVTGTGYSASLH